MIAKQGQIHSLVVVRAHTACAALHRQHGFASAPGTFDYNERKYREATAGNEKGEASPIELLTSGASIWGF